MERPGLAPVRALPREGWRADTLSTGRDAELSELEALAITTDAYVYAYPLVVMEVTRRTLTDAARGDPPALPLNQFAHERSLPDASCLDVPYANVDMLSSSLFFDVSDEPLIIDLPDSGGRYYALSALDAWSEVFASFGTRTTGTGARRLALIGPCWEGPLPSRIEAIRAATETGWLIGRTLAGTVADRGAVHRLQNGMKARTLGDDGQREASAIGPAYTTCDAEALVERVDRLDAATFWEIFATASRANRVHSHDYPMLHRLQRLGLHAGSPFHAFDASRLRIVEEGALLGHERILRESLRLGRPVNGWRMLQPPVGTYGTDYLRRAAAAMAYLGASLPEDALHATATVDLAGEPLDSAASYVLHFDSDALPPVRGSWSLTMYDARQLLAANPLGRYALGSGDRLAYHRDGSLDLCLQRIRPDDADARNWLPTPLAGPFSLVLRLYWPRATAANGQWAPNAVVRLA